MKFRTNPDSGPTVIMHQVREPAVRTNCDFGPRVRDIGQCDLTISDYGPTVKPNRNLRPSVWTECAGPVCAPYLSDRISR